MRRKYRNWIRRYAKGNVEGLCSEYTILMHATFPELKMIEGEYHQPGEVYPDGHCWLLDEEGKIVDPTFSQFEPGGDYNTPQNIWFPTISRELFELACRTAEIICGEKLLPDNTWVAWQVRTLLEHYEDEIKERDKDKKHKSEEAA